MSCSKEEKASIEIDEKEINLTNDGSETQLIITSNVSWTSSLSGDKEGIQCSPSHGEAGTTKVSIKASPNATIQNRNASLTITGEGATATVQIKQSPLTFEITPESLVFNPEDTSHELTITSDVNWEITDQNWPEWISISPLSGKGNGSIQVKVNDHNKHNSKSFTLSIEFSGIQALIPVIIESENDEYGGYTIYQTSKKAHPIKLIITGDGYLPSHFNDGGLFDQNADEAIEALFAVEPYKTYREYFSVYKMRAFSKETGMSSEVDNIWKNTVFSSRLTGGTGVECDYDKVFYYALLNPDITEEDLENTSICVIINENTYAGTCYTISNGKSVAMIPVSHPHPEESFYTIEFPNVVRHEFGGHGFGRLADEYIAYDTTIPDEEKVDLLAWQKYNYNLNVSPYYTKEQVPWSRFIGKPEYSHVGIFEGGYYYPQGVTRSEDISCMDDNRPYFNTQSRYLIVERILQATGEGELTYQKFFDKDVQKTSPFTRSLITPKNFKPLAPPIRIMDKSNTIVR
ncbi:M64 family metallopeptidase [Bacteroides sp.]|uniref:M64 family metallopeptidase n=1 Tax=Bacteroides sp. TaxID=29523 RepID=UPI0026034E79|nr:M64 family metallopeptidase [Bacteroides sp.]